MSREFHWRSQTFYEGVQRESRLEIELEDKGPYRDVCEYMSGGEMDELRRTSRTVCHRLVTPLPTLL